MRRPRRAGEAAAGSLRAAMSRRRSRSSPGGPADRVHLAIGERQRLDQVIGDALGAHFRQDLVVVRAGRVGEPPPDRRGALEDDRHRARRYVLVSIISYAASVTSTPSPCRHRKRRPMTSGCSVVTNTATRCSGSPQASRRSHSSATTSWAAARCARRRPATRPPLDALGADCRAIRPLCPRRTAPPSLSDGHARTGEALDGRDRRCRHAGRGSSRPGTPAAARIRLARAAGLPRAAFLAGCTSMAPQDDPRPRSHRRPPRTQRGGRSLRLAGDRQRDQAQGARGSAEATRLRVRYSYFDASAPGATDWTRVLRAERACTGLRSATSRWRAAP